MAITSILFIHGGGWISGHPDAMNALMQPYKDLGFNCGSVSYPFTGVANAVSAVRAVNDYCKMFGPTILWGFSAGATLALNLAVRGESDAAVAFCGPSDLVNAPVAQGYWFGPGHWATLNMSVEDRRAMSPINRVQSDCAPLYLGYGTSDPIVPHMQGIDLYHKAKAQEPDVKFTSMSGVGHEIPAAFSYNARVWLTNRFSPAGAR